MIKQSGRFMCFIKQPDAHTTMLLKKEFTYTKKSARFMANPEWGKVRLYDEKRARFPIGLARRYYNIAYNTPYQVPMTDMLLTELRALPLREYQKYAVQAIGDHMMGIIQIPTGGGKTRVALVAIDFFFKDRTILVLVPTLDLKAQWLAQHKRITVATYQSVKDRRWLQSFDVVFMDECHHAAAKTIFKIGMNIREDARIYGLSATPFMREEDNLKVEAVLGPIVYKIEPQQLIDMGYLVQPEIVFVNYPAKQEQFYLTYKDAYDDLIVNNIHRNLAIANLCNRPGKILVLVTRIEHGELLLQQLRSVGLDCVFLSGEHTAAQRLDTDHKILIATQIYDEGVDLPDLNVLIMAGGGKSDIKTLQRVGRLLRTSQNKQTAQIYDFNDIGKFVSAHSKLREKVLSNVFGSSNISSVLFLPK